MSFKEFLLAGGIALTLFSCSKDKSNVAVEPFQDETFNIFPKPTAPQSAGSTGYTGWIGDVMPHYAEGKFQLFFLHDATDAVKQSSPGQHPIHRFTTEDALNFTYEGEAIPYGNANTQDQLVGTGSMVKAGNTYYFYYTGFNSNTSWLQNNNTGWTSANTREAVMYATSTDLKTWTKKQDFILRAPAGYTANEFRDPYVFYNDEFNEYWMLMSAQQGGKGVILVFTSDDPATDNWQVRGNLNVEGNYLMMECSDIFKMGNKYYMLFAEDWTGTPGTHYRVSNSSNGPWVKPTGGTDMFDGHQFYAGRVATNGADFYTFGWAHRRNPVNDNGTRNWGGNLISHQLVQLSGDRLGVKSPDAVQSYFTKEADLTVAGQTGTVDKSGSSYAIDGSTSASMFKFGEIKGTAKIAGNISLSNLTGTASIGFNASANNTGTYIIKFDPANNRIAAWNYGTEVTRVPFNFEAGKSYSFSIVIDNSVAVLYVNDEVALTNRVYSLQNHMWSFGAENTKVTLGNLKLLTH
ncbi:DUF4975 domain-containing protein [Mucilaginibacter limnophilus]|uniref:beta-fructofuranosidase n=1 Tax=Mucilaginibacter limnophilus TaxID=1932778 RepID=A0A3S2WXL4_9SPHI|nr:glycoside hydrolase family 32 protein [Mucilaginibacter limnophilus]RVU00418.1 DUF4975 domain-containing protein [Mucilaginibacter limnophilus]